MNWLPKDSDIYTIATGLIPVIATVVGMLQMFAQQSRAGRARRIINWVNDIIDHNDDTTRISALNELRLSEESKVFAVHCIPWWRFYLFPFWSLTIGYFLASDIAQYGMSGSSIASLLYYGMFSIYFAGQFIGSYVERVSIAEQYRSGELKVTRIPLWRMGWGLIWRSIVCAMCVCALVVSSVMEMRGQCSPLFQVISSVVQVISFVALFSFFILSVRKYARNWVKTTTKATKAEDVGNEDSNTMPTIMKELNSDKPQDHTNQSSVESHGSSPQEPEDNR